MERHMLEDEEQATGNNFDPLLFLGRLLCAYLLSPSSVLCSFYRDPGGGATRCCRGQPGDQAMEEAEKQSLSEPDIMGVPTT